VCACVYSLLLAETMKRCKKLETHLPDCVISYIFSNLGLKDLVKTSVLSKRWLPEWGLRMDLNFDLQNMFDHNTIQNLQESIPLFQSEFATRLDQFMQHYHGATIRSIKVKFPLGDDHSYAIDRLISQGITKGVNRIELLFSYDTDLEMEPYKFSFTLLSNTHSLAHLHLQNCRIVAPMDFSGFKNLRTLVFHVVRVTQDILHGLFSNCIHLADFTLDDCQFNSDLKIISPTLFHLNIVNCWVDYWPKNIDIVTSNLTSIEYSCNGSDVHSMNIKAHMLSKFSFRGCQIPCQIPEHFEFSGLKNVTTVVLDGIHLSCIQNDVLPLLFSECLQLEDVTFKNCKIVLDLKIISPKLRHLKIFDCGDRDIFPWRVIIDALNLLSFEFSCNIGKFFSVNAPRLSKVFWNAARREKNPPLFGPIATLQHIEILAMILNFSQVSHSKPMFAC